MRCESCNSLNVGPCPSQIEGIDMKELSKCFCCNQIFESKLNQFNERPILYYGEK